MGPTAEKFTDMMFVVQPTFELGSDVRASTDEFGINQIPASFTGVGCVHVTIPETSAEDDTVIWVASGEPHPEIPPRLFHPVVLFDITDGIFTKDPAGNLKLSDGTYEERTP